MCCSYKTEGSISYLVVYKDIHIISKLLKQQGLSNTKEKVWGKKNTAEQ